MRILVRTPVSSAVTVFVVAAALLASTGAAAADNPRLLTLDHPAYEAIQLLQAAGHLPGLNPLVQPYRRDEVARHLAALDPAALAPELRHWAELLHAELEGDAVTDSKEVRWGSWIEAGGTGSTSRRMDPLRKAGDDTDGWLHGRGGGWITAHGAAAEVVGLEDQYLHRDPEGIDPQRRVGRTESAYLAVALPFGDLTIGRFARNWSRPGSSGLMVADHATPYPQIGLTFRAGRLTLRSFVGELDTLETYKRYIGAHRLDLAWPNLVISAGEAVVFASERSGFSLRHLNPVEVFYSDTDAEPRDQVQNVVLDLSVWARRGTFEGWFEALLDDIDVSPAEGADREPTGYALAAGARWTHASGTRGAGAEYRRVSAWAYRTPNEVDRWTYLGRGLAQNFSDFERVTVWGDWLAPVPGLRLRPTFEVLRSGEGDFRDPTPEYADYLASPNMFVGVRETVVRGALRGRYQPRREAWIAWDAGMNRVTDSGHLEGEDETEFSGTVAAGVRFDLFPFR